MKSDPLSLGVVPQIPGSAPDQTLAKTSFYPVGPQVFSTISFITPAFPKRGGIVTTD